jgi:hypothetical protein
MLPVATYKTLLASRIASLHLEASVAVGFTPEGLTHFALTPVRHNRYSW